jgi:SOS response regulatory protein OraA/RecX
VVFRHRPPIGAFAWRRHGEEIHGQQQNKEFERALRVLQERERERESLIQQVAKPRISKEEFAEGPAPRELLLTPVVSSIDESDCYLNDTTFS